MITNELNYLVHIHSIISNIIIGIRFHGIISTIYWTYIQGILSLITDAKISLIICKIKS